jgi:hypothetical protein
LNFLSSLSALCRLSSAADGQGNTNQAGAVKGDEHQNQAGWLSRLFVRNIDTGHEQHSSQLSDKDTVYEMQCKLNVSFHVQVLSVHAAVVSVSDCVLIFHSGHLTSARLKQIFTSHMTVNS